jgi:surface carbohydrate biosynthesis protein
MTPAPNRLAYLLCELKARDFAARLMIAEELLKRRCPVVVGQRWSIAFNARFAPRGCYLFPTSNAIQAATMEGVAAAGHLIAAADEEALALAGEAVLLNVAPATLDRSVFLTHSTDQHETLRAKYPKADLRLTGSARVDLLRREATGAGKGEGYVLFNTNFPMTNGLWGDREAAAAPLRQVGLTDIDERFAFEEARKTALIPVIEKALRLLTVPVVIRPHPAESPTMWRDLAQGHPHARVVVGESPGPWIAGARIVVHADCTTGLEAALMGKPVLNISTHDWGRKFLMHAVNPTVTSSADG